MYNKEISTLTTYQKFSIWLSSLCLIHCLITPFIIILLPSVSSFVDGWVETALIAAVIPVSLFSFIPIWLKHKNLTRLFELLAGIALVLIAQLVIHGSSHTFGSFIAAIEMLLMIAGTSLIAYATYRNRRHTHHCHNPHHAH